MRSTGGVIEVDVMVVPIAVWMTLPQREQPGWSVWTDRQTGLVQAVRVVG